MAKIKDPYEGWNHDDFEKEAEQLRRKINKSIDSINKEYHQGKRPEMSEPFEKIKKGKDW